MTKVLYPGSFNPITKGHMSIIKESCNLFDEVIIAVLNNPLKKNELFSLKERLEIIKEIYKNEKNIKVVTSNEATVDIALKYNCKAIIRGLRSLSDFEYEISLQQINRELSNNLINTICLFPPREYEFISSSMVREIFNLNKDISKYVDELVLKKMKERR